MKAKAVTRRLAALKAQRQPHEQTWQECFEFSFPERGHGLNGANLTPQDAQTKKNRILDDTAADSARILSASLVSGTTPANSIWFGLDAGLEDGDESQGYDTEKRWLDSSARTIFANIHASNFDAAAFECCIDMVPAGWFVLYVDEAAEGGYHFEQWPVAQCFISASRPGGVVDTIYREVELTVEQVVAQYGIDKVSQRVAEAYRNEQFDEKVTICHAIEPRRLSLVGGGRMAKNLPFASYHVETATQHMLRESGYHEFPCAVPRWMLVPGTAYASGPMSNALGSIRSINDIKALELANLDMAASGMYVAEDDGVMNPRMIKIGPRRVIVANSVDSIKPLAPAGNFNITFTAEERLQAAIRKALLADQLQPQDGPAMTATEVHVRVQLIRQLLGPIYGRLQAEYLQPLITRCFGIAYRAGILGAAPETLQGRQFSVKYISPLARAQKMEEVAAIDQYVSGAAAVAELNPDILDTIDFDAAQEVRGEALGVPAKVRRSQKQIGEIRQARAQAAQQAQSQALEQEVITKAAPEMLKKAA